MELTTALTDYALAVVYGYFGVRLHRRGKTAAAAVFALTAMVSAAGGTHHALEPSLRAARAATWQVVLIGFGWVGFALLFCAAGVAGVLQKPLVALAAVKLAVYLYWTWQHDEFRIAIYDYAGSMIILTAVAFWRMPWPVARWILAGTAASFASSAIQQSGFSLHARFNYNDLYHVVQMVSAWLFYRGFSGFTADTTRAGG
ncbi:MAG: DUF6962 family protein [Bryobacteraceae bacterium]